MDVRSQNVYWPGLLPETPAYPQIEKNLECDVIIVGAGVSGACCAFELKNTGLSVVVVDKQKVAGGSTSANTGLLQFSSDQLLHQAVKAFGKKKAVDHYRRCYKAIVRLREEILPELSIDPKLIMRNSLYLASSQEDKKTLWMEYQSLTEAGFTVQYLKEDEIKEWIPFARPAAIVTSGDAEIDPYRLTHGLIASAANSGVKVFENTEISIGKADKDGIEIQTKSGYTIKSKKAIFAQGYEIQDVIKEKKVTIDSTYSIVTNEIQDLSFWKESAMIWETARPYFYARTTADHRIIIGGLDERIMNPVKRDSKLADKRNKLIAELESWFPPLKGRIRADYYWSGLFAHTEDGQPVIGQYEHVPNSYFLLGYGGNGTVASLFLSRLVARHITGEKDDAFSFYSRNRLYSEKRKKQ